MFTILYVNGEEAKRREVAGILEGERARALLASSVDEAIDVLRAEHVDMMLMDITLLNREGMDVYETFRAIRPGLHIVTTASHQSYRARFGGEQ